MARLQHPVLIIGALMGAVVGPGATSAEAGAVQFLPHRAVYDISLVRATPGSGISEMTGRMVYELVGSDCAGYTQKMRFVTRVTGRDGEAQLNDLRTTSWEKADGKQLHFTTSQYRDDQLEESTEGKASRTGPGNAVEVRLTKPGPKGLELDAGVMFPMQHSAALIEAGRKGETRLIAELYDGSEKGEKVYLTNAFIGEPVAPAEKLEGVAPEALKKLDLNSRSAWPMAISYYDVPSDGKDAVPSYELSFRLFDNGVSTKLFIDYGDFSVEGALVDVTLLEKTACEGGKAAN
jgi:hypothetical protein